VKNFYILVITLFVTGCGNNSTDNTIVLGLSTSPMMEMKLIVTEQKE